jgi:hypothetical protein
LGIDAQGDAVVVDLAGELKCFLEVGDGIRPVEGDLDFP